MPESRIRRWRPRRRPPGDAEAEIAVDWERIADGRPRRLRRGVDFGEPVVDFVESARAAAAHGGRSVVVTRDRSKPDRFVWMQFADAEVAIGDPCPCGGRSLTRITAVLLRCDTCGAMLVAGVRPKRGGQAEEDGASGGEKKPVPTLNDFSEVRLARTEERSDLVEYVGLAVDGAGSKVLLVVHAPLVDGQPVPDPRSPTGQAHRIVAVVPESLWGAGAADGDDQAWDIVVA